MVLPSKPTAAATARVRGGSGLRVSSTPGLGSLDSRAGAFAQLDQARFLRVLFQLRLFFYGASLCLFLFAVFPRATYRSLTIVAVTSFTLRVHDLRRLFAASAFNYVVQPSAVAPCSVQPACGSHASYSTTSICAPPDIQLYAYHYHTSRLRCPCASTTSPGTPRHRPGWSRSTFFQSLESTWRKRRSPEAKSQEFLVVVTTPTGWSWHHAGFCRIFLVQRLCCRPGCTL